MLAEHYHEQTKHSRTSILGGGPLDFSTRPTVFKEYPQAELIELPPPMEEAGLSVDRAVAASRRSASSFSSQAMSLEELSTILFMTNGVTSTLNTVRGTYYLRSAPSAGALYPTVTYIFVQNVTGLERGLYHYAAKEHALHRLTDEGIAVEDLAGAVPRHSLIREAPVTFLFTSVFFRSGWKYHDRAYRYCCLDAGHLAVQAHLASASLGYAGKLIGRFDDSAINRLLDFDETEEACMLIMPVGNTGEDDGEISIAQKVFESSPREFQADRDPIMHLIHGRTYLARTGHEEAAPFLPHPPAAKHYADSPRITLPETAREGDDLFTTVRRRRSIRNWADRSMPLSDLSSVLHCSFGATQLAELRYDPSVENNHSLHLYVLINDVEDLEPGVYYYNRADDSLILIRSGDQRRQGYLASLPQDAVGDAHAALIMTIDKQRLGFPDGDRGYRYAALDAGMLGGRTYLQATGLGLGCCGIGAYFDDEINALIDADPAEEMVVYMAAIGVRLE